MEEVGRYKRRKKRHRKSGERVWHRMRCGTSWGMRKWDREMVVPRVRKWGVAGGVLGDLRRTVTRR